MSSTEVSQSQPIYERLVRERGNVPAEARTVAEETQAQVAHALDWSTVRNPQTGTRGFSAFG